MSSAAAAIHKYVFHWIYERSNLRDAGVLCVKSRPHSSSKRVENADTSTEVIIQLARHLLASSVVVPRIWHELPVSEM